MYDDDLPVFTWLRAQATSPLRTCLEAQVMDWADDVAYSVHDVEDGIHGGYLRLALLRDDESERQALCSDVASAYSAESAGDLAAVLDEVLDDPALAPMYAFDGSHRALVGLKQATSVLTGRFRRGRLDGDVSSQRRAAVVAATTRTSSCRAGPGPSARCSRDWRCAT